MIQSFDLVALLEWLGCGMALLALGVAVILLASRIGDRGTRR